MEEFKPGDIVEYVNSYGQRNVAYGLGTVQSEEFARIARSTYGYSSGVVVLFEKVNYQNDHPDHKYNCHIFINPRSLRKVHIEVPYDPNQLEEDGDL